MSERRLIAAITAVAVGLVIVLALNVVVLLDVSRTTTQTAAVIATKAQQQAEQKYVDGLITEIEMHVDATIRLAVHELLGEISLICLKVKAC